MLVILALEKQQEYGKSKAWLACIMTLFNTPSHCTPTRWSPYVALVGLELREPPASARIKGRHHALLKSGTCS